MKVFIAIPCAELSRYSEFWLSLEGQRLPDGTRKWGCGRGLYVGTNQNTCAREFLASDAEYFWLVNDDQIYPPDTLARLLAHRQDIVVPVCLGHDFPFVPLIYQAHATVPEALQARYLRKEDQGLIEVRASGGGGMLVHRRVLETIADPWWEVYTVHPPDQLPHQISEDFDFCEKAIAAGFRILADTEALVGHQTVFSVWPQRTPDGSWVSVIARNKEYVALPAASSPAKGV